MLGVRHAYGAEPVRVFRADHPGDGAQEVEESDVALRRLECRQLVPKAVDLFPQFGIKRWGRACSAPHERRRHVGEL